MKPSAETLRHKEWAEQQPVTTTCAHCDYTITATVAQAREAAATHRAEAHPDLKPRKRLGKATYCKVDGCHEPRAGGGGRYGALCAQHKTEAQNYDREARTAARATTLQLKRPTAKRHAASPRQRQGRDPAKVRGPSDLKRYPLPPAPDGRANDRTSRDSPTTARSKLTPAILRRAAEAHKEGETPWQIAGWLWQEAGFSSQHACKGSLYRAFAAMGLTTVTSARKTTG